MQQRVQRTIFCVILAVIFSSAAACRRAAVTQPSTPASVNASAKPSPQPSACAAENVSRAALLRATQTPPAPSAPR